MPERIQELHRQWQEKLAVRQAAIAAGLIEPKKKKWKKSKDQHETAWAKAKALCRLNMEDIRMAKEMGMSPRSLMKNVPSPTQPWKAAVKFWIRDLYAKRQEKAARRHPPDSAGSAPPPRSPAPNQPPGPQTPQPEQDPPSFSDSEF